MCRLVSARTWPPSERYEPLDASELATRLATAPGDVELVELLAKGQECKRLLQLLALAKKSSAEHVSVLTRVQRAAPAALRTVLRDPSAITGLGHDVGAGGGGCCGRRRSIGFCAGRSP